VSPPRESTVRNFTVTAIVAVVCSLAVSLAEVALRPYRLANRDLATARGVLEAAGAYDPAVPIERTAARIESRFVDLDTGAYVAEEDYDPDATILLGDDDPADIEVRERHARIWLVRDGGAVAAIVLPIRGTGWSPMKGFLGLDRDLVTIRGLTFSEHAETAGMGAEIDNPKWKALWPGKQAFDASGAVTIRVVKPGSTSPSPTTVDGISGASLTSEGVDALVRFWLSDRGFGLYLARLRREGVDRE